MGLNTRNLQNTAMTLKNVKEVDFKRHPGKRREKLLQNKNKTYLEIQSWSWTHFKTTVSTALVKCHPVLNL